MSLVPWWCIFFYVTGCHSHNYKRGGAWNGYEFHTYPHPAKKTIIPRDTMVDVINNLGLKLLAIHNEYNENNIAISPYGALSVLVVLGEGLEGDAVQEIQQATHLPNDISVIRIGLRDIHRHLKSYFIPKEGFLAGLTLNHENVTLRPEYEEILKFYGYDTVSFNNALFPQPETTEKPHTTSRGPTPTTTDQTTTETIAASTDLGKSAGADGTTTETTTFETTKTTTETEKPVTTLTPDTTTEKTATTLLDLSTIPTLPQSTVAEPMTVEPKSTEITSTNVPTTTMEAITKSVTTNTAATTKVKSITTEQITTETDTTLAGPTTEIVLEGTTFVSSRTTREEPTTTVTSATETMTVTTSTDPPPTPFTITKDSTTEYTTILNVLTTLTEITTSLLTTPLSTTTETLITTQLPISTPQITRTELFTTTDVSTNTIEEESTLPTTETILSEPTDNTPVVNTITVVIPNTLPSTEVSDESTETSSSTEALDTSTVTDKVNEIDTTNASVEDVGFGGVVKRKTRSGEGVKGANVVELNMRGATYADNKRNSRSVVDYIIARYYDDHYVRHRHQRPYIPKEGLSFLIYGKYREYNINFMKYDTVLPFFYVPHLQTLALSFPLDSTKYYLLLLLPIDETGIDKLICDLRLNGSLRYIIANLRYTHVVATIPSFTLKGYVTLTPSFQKLGIRKVFEPRQADFTPMTNQSQIYVTNIEQAITVTIRNYVDPETMNDYGNLHQYDPVHFKADHPFLYFVIDTEIHVTLMAGKIVNPLNSRIS